MLRAVIRIAKHPHSMFLRRNKQNHLIKFHQINIQRENAMSGNSTRLTHLIGMCGDPM